MKTGFKLHSSLRLNYFHSFQVNSLLIYLGFIYFSFRPHQNATAVAGSRTYALEHSHATPCVLSYTTVFNYPALVSEKKIKRHLSVKFESQRIQG